LEGRQINDIERERTVGEILNAALAIYRRYPLLFAALAVGVIAPFELAKLSITGVGPFGSAGSESAGTLALFELIYYVLVGPLISALHVHAVVDIGAGRAPKLGDVAIRGLRVLPVVVAAEIIAGILIALGFIALVIPGVILSLRWAVVAQTAAVDNEGWLPALRRSRTLTQRNYMHIFGLQIAVALLTSGIGLVFGLGTAGNGAGAGSVLLGIAVYTVIASFTALTLAILYFDLRARQSTPAHRSTPEYQELRDLD
jgi:hypothetical protein